MESPLNCPRHDEQVIAQRASSDLLLFNLHDGNYYSLDEVGCRIWELCDGNHTVGQIIDTLAAEYEAPKEELHQDAVELLEQLRKGKLIVEA